ncbi:arsenate reductase family protein [Helicobacter marmotae]|uniref:ArsC family transcriptional regulator n=1 Tax=Helicobacter marmotae TaxID=152490 RepID=A0A3D8I432_9HELI|nr:arsenate reductase family protein [Helicobacter marmotae]RDU59913.1 ArsC family transcriptional regulator [Helicobacter marmotae]
MITLYGIKTCGSVKKAITLLDKHSIPFDFIDLKTHSLQDSLIQSWIKQKGIAIVLNNKGTTYKKLKKEGIITDEQTDIKAQISLLKQYPLLLKRPIITAPNTLIIGYDESGILELIQTYQNQRF